MLPSQACESGPRTHVCAGRTSRCRQVGGPGRLVFLLNTRQVSWGHQLARFLCSSHSATEQQIGPLRAARPLPGPPVCGVVFFVEICGRAAPSWQACSFHKISPGRASMAYPAASQTSVPSWWKPTAVGGRHGLRVVRCWRDNLVQGTPDPLKRAANPEASRSASGRRNARKGVGPGRLSVAGA